MHKGLNRDFGSARTQLTFYTSVMQRQARKNLLTQLVLATLILALMPVIPASAINNTECKKPKKTKSIDGKKFRCVSNGESLVWANKKLRKKIAKQITRDIVEKQKSKSKIINAEETKVEPPKNPDPVKNTFSPEKFDRGDFRSLRSEGFESIRNLQNEYLRYKSIYKAQNENLLMDYQRALSDIDSSGWLEYDAWYAEIELQLVGDRFEEYMNKARKRVESEILAGISSINETESYYNSFPQLLEDYIRYYRENDPTFTDALLREAFSEAETLFQSEFDRYRAEVAEQEHQYQTWVAENLKYQQVDLSRFNRIYRNQYNTAISNLQESLKNVEAAGYIEDAKWIAEYELGLTGRAYEEYISNAIADAEKRIVEDIASYQQTLQYYEDNQRQLLENVAYLESSEYDFAEELLRDALNEAVLLAEREYQVFVADQIRWAQSDLLTFKSQYESEYRERVAQFQQEIAGVEASEDFIIQREYAEQQLGLTGSDLETYLNDLRTQIISNIQEQLQYYQETLDEYADRESSINEQIEYLHENEYDFTDQLLNDALDAAAQEAAERESEYQASEQENSSEEPSDSPEEQPSDNQSEEVNAEE